MIVAQAARIDERPETPLSLDGLNGAQARRRLSAPAVALFVRACDLWDLKVEDRQPSGRFSQTKGTPCCQFSS